MRRITRLPLALLSEVHPLYTLSCSWRSWWYMIALPPAVQSSTTAVRPAFRRDEKPASFRHFGRRVGRLPGEPPHKRGGAPKAPIGRVRGNPLWLIFCADARVGGWEGLPSLVAGGGERLTLPLFGNDGRRRHQSPFRGVAPVNAQATPHIFIAFATPRQRRPLPILASGISSYYIYRALPLYHRRGGGYSTKWPAMNPSSTRRASPRSRDSDGSENAEDTYHRGS